MNTIAYNLIFTIQTRESPAVHLCRTFHRQFALELGHIFYVDGIHWKHHVVKNMVHYESGTEIDVFLAPIVLTAEASERVQKDLRERAWTPVWPDVPIGTLL